MKKVIKKFFVKSNDFALYTKFKTEAEKAGWIYEWSFNSFEESKMDAMRGLYFDSDWHGTGKRFSFSCSDELTFELETQWSEAVAYLIDAPFRPVPEAEYQYGQEVEYLKTTVKFLSQHGVFAWVDCAEWNSPRTVFLIDIRPVQLVRDRVKELIQPKLAYAKDADLLADRIIELVKNEKV